MAWSAWCFFSVGCVVTACALDASSLVQMTAPEARAPESLYPTGYYWPGKNGDALRTGTSPHTVLVNLTKGPTWSWHEKNNGIIRATPLIDNKKNIYLATVSGNVHKFSPEGQIRWSYHDNHSIPEVPVLYDGYMYFTNDHGWVTALDMINGKVRWQAHSLRKSDTSAGDTWSMSAGEGTVVAAVSTNGQSNDKLLGLDAKSGSLLWSFKPDGPVYNSLQAIKQKSLVFADLSGRVYRLNLADGTLIWKAEPAGKDPVRADFSTGGAVISPSGHIYVTSNAHIDGIEKKVGFLTAFNFETGERMWRQYTEYEANTAPAVGSLAGWDGPEAVVVGVGENPSMPDKDHQLIYNMADNSGYLPEKKSRVVAFDAESGDPLWSAELPTWHGWAAGDTLYPEHICLPDSFGNPSIGGDGTIFIGSQNGRFYAIKDRNGDGKIDTETDELSSWDTQNAFQGSPAIAPGMVAATPCNGLHVWRTK